MTGSPRLWSGEPSPELTSSLTLDRGSYTLGVRSVSMSGSVWVGNFRLAIWLPLGPFSELSIRGV